MSALGEIFRGVSGRILLANPDFGSHRLMMKVSKVVGKMHMFDGRCEGGSCRWQRSDERLGPLMHSRNSLCSKKEF
jgi:hypothetical protein